MQFNNYTLLEHFGIIPAVNEFVIQTNSEVMFYCFSWNQHDDIGIKVNKKYFFFFQPLFMKERLKI